MAQLPYWIWLTTRKRLTLRGQQLALSYFGTPEEIYRARQSDIEQVQGLTDKEVAALGQKDLDGAKTILEMCSDQGIRVITSRDTAYPQRLLAIDVPPLVLYYRGKFMPFDEPAGGNGGWFQKGQRLWSGSGPAYGKPDRRLRRRGGIRRSQGH